MPAEVVAEINQHAVAQPLGIALAGPSRKSHDLLCENFVCQIAAINKPKRDQSHFEPRAP